MIATIIISSILFTYTAILIKNGIEDTILALNGDGCSGGSSYSCSSCSKKNAVVNFKL